jgi:hypothetical protein
VDGLTFVAEMIKALVWPLVVVILLWIFREPLRSLLLALRSAKAEIAGQKLDLGFGDPEKVEQLAQDALKGAPTTPPDKLTAEDLTAIALARQLVAVLLTGTEEAPRVHMEDGSTASLGLHRPMENTPLSDLLDAVLKVRDPNMGSFTLAVIKQVVEEAEAKRQRVKDAEEAQPRP